MPSPLMCRLHIKGWYILEKLPWISYRIFCNVRLKEPYCIISGWRVAVSGTERPSSNRTCLSNRR